MNRENELSRYALPAWLAFGYPKTVAECLRPNRKYRPDVLRAMKKFRRSRPWRGTLAERKAKFRELHYDLCITYGISCLIRLHQVKEPETKHSNGRCGCGEIELFGRLSVLTYLHEFAHALGKNERQAAIWSINLFRRIFPRSFARCRQVGHVLLRAENAENGLDNG